MRCRCERLGRLGVCEAGVCEAGEAGNKARVSE